MWEMGADEEKHWCGCHGVRMVKDRTVSIIVTIARSSLRGELLRQHPQALQQQRKSQTNEALSLSRQLYVNTVPS